MDFRRSIRRQRVFRFIVEYKQKHDGNSPTLREIMDGCGISSTSVTSYYLRRLEQDGLVTLSETGKKIEVAGGKWVFKGERLW